MPKPSWPTLLVVLALAKISAALALPLVQAVSGGPTVPLPWPYVAFMLEFGLVAVALVVSTPDDRRGLLLGAMFALAATSFADALLLRESAHSEVARVLAAFQIDAFQPALVWAFVGAFPEPLTGNRPQAIVRASTWFATLVGAALFAINLSFLAMSPDAASSTWRAVADRHRPGSFYWGLLFATALPAYLFLAWRARTTHASGRRRIVTFVSGLMIALLPIGIDVIAEALIPPFRVMMTRTPWDWTVRLIVYTLLAVSPIIVAYSVLVDHVLELRFAVRAAVRYTFGRYTILAAVVVPFALLAVDLYHHRGETIGALFAGPGPLALVLITAAAVVALRLRQRAIDELDRRFFREHYDAQQILGRLIDETRKQGDLRGLASLVASDIDRALHLHNVALIVANDEGAELYCPDGRVRAFPVHSGLGSLLAASDAPLEIDLDTPTSPLQRLPEADRQWLADGAFRLLIPLIASDRTLIGLLALGDKLSDLRFSRDDRLMLDSLANSLSLTVENRRLRASPARLAVPMPIGGPVDDAVECGDCQNVYPSTAMVCPCGGTLRPAPVPLVLLGKFRFERRIGAGGMGVVYRAVDLALGRSVAIKTLPQMSPEYATRLRREARAMAAVSHPNLAPIYGAETWRGTPMLVCEFLRGGTLAGRLRAGPLGIDEALTIAVAIAAAVEYIHGVGILHCDIKPSNIGFTDEHCPKLLDFGLARITQDVPLSVADPEATTHSAAETIAVSRSGPSAGSLTHHLVGTPLYMAPEAIRGERPSNVFDLWGVAVVLFEMLAGQPPYRGQTVSRIHDAIERGPAPDVRALRPDCPAPIAVFLQAALSSDRGRRPSNARALAAVLQDLRTSLSRV